MACLVSFQTQQETWQDPAIMDFLHCSTGDRRAAALWSMMMALFHDYKDVGLVNDVFTRDVLDRLGYGNIAVGHVRYGTTGGNGRLNAQPIVVNHVKGRMALAHNGNLTNSFELREELELTGSIFHTTSDTEVILYHHKRTFDGTIHGGCCQSGDVSLKRSVLTGHHVSVKIDCSQR